MPKRLIVNADDFGLSPGVNRGIVKGIDNGIVTSTTMMLNMPGQQDAFSILSERPDISVGLHFNITAGKPVSLSEDIPSLVDDKGCFYNIRTLIPLLNGGMITPDDIAKEFEAQVTLMKENGISISHIDSHKHLHLFPDVLETITNMTHDMDIKAMRYTEKTPREVFNSMGIDVQGLEANPTISEIRESQIKVPDGLLGLDVVGKLSPRTLKNLLSILPDGSWELMCHPAEIDEDLTRLSSLTNGRQEDLSGLIDTEVQQEVENSGIELISFKEI